MESWMRWSRKPSEIALHSGFARDHETRRRAQKIGLLVEQIKVTGSLLNQGFRLRADPFGAEDRDECRLAAGRVLVDFLAGLRGLAFEIEQIIGDLISEANFLTVGGQRLACRHRGLAHD